MKSYTDIEQIKKLAEILPIETADMWVHPYWDDVPNIGNADLSSNQIPCWSLAALLNVLPNGYVIVKNYHGFYFVESRDHEKSTSVFNNPIDACYKMIIRLNELNLL